MAFTPIVGTLAYLWDREADQVLMIRRNARQEDDHFGKINGLGGKLEPDESVTEGLRRELDEEAGVELTQFQLRGTITWTNFGPNREEWLGFIFLVDRWNGEPPASNEEGTLEWVSRSRLIQSCEAADPALDPEFPMWAGDRHSCHSCSTMTRAFHGTMPYDGDVPRSWTFERI